MINLLSLFKATFSNLTSAILSGVSDGTHTISETTRLVRWGFCRISMEILELRGSSKWTKYYDFFMYLCSIKRDQYSSVVLKTIF